MSSILQWKQEPASPLSECDEAVLLDATFYNTTPFENVYIKFDADADLEAIATFESKAEVASHLLENLENLMDLDELIKDEPFLLDEKMLPILDEVEPPRAVHVPVQNLKSEYINSSNTQHLLKEFETVYNVVEFNNGTLTPPQSPPSHQPMLTTLEPLLFHGTKQYLSESYAPTEQIVYAPVNTPQPDIAHELAVVDELVRSRVEDMQGSSRSSIGGSSPRSPGSSSCSNFGDCSSDDPEWVPEPIEDYSCDTPVKQSRKRSRPYNKNATEDKKVRKKEQNKNAATRYRIKKKAEIEEILLVEKDVLSNKLQLDNQICDLNREIKYLKGLMRDLFKAKGLIN